MILYVGQRRRDDRYSSPVLGPSFIPHLSPPYTRLYGAALFLIIFVAWQLLIVTPTRELAVQCVQETLAPMSRHMIPPLGVREDTGKREGERRRTTKSALITLWSNR